MSAQAQIEQKITEHLKDAMRAKDQVVMDCLRGMKSALKYKSVEKNQAALTEEEILQTFQSMIKQRKEAAAEFEKYGKADAAAKENREIGVIQSFMPQAFSEVELKALIQSAIEASDAKTQRDLGKVMKELKPKITGRADAKQVTDLVRSQLPAG